MRFTQNIDSVQVSKLDLKDKKILYHLSENARMPYTKIAKKVGLSKDAVKYRIKRLEKSGVIQGYIASICTSCLGYDTYHIFLQLNRVNGEIKSNLIRKFKSYPFTKVIIEFSGRYDFEIGIAARSIEEVDSVISTIIGDVYEYLQSYHILAISNYYESRVFPSGFLEADNGKCSRRRAGANKIDKTDVKILNILSNKARLPLYEIGNMTGLSPDAVNYRIRNLLKSGTILNFVPAINYSVLGYTIYAVMMNIHNLSIANERTLRQFLSTNRNILWAVKTIGKYNLLMYICVEKSRDLHKTLIGLRDVFSSNIRDYETLIANEEYKYTYFPAVCMG